MPQDLLSSLPDAFQDALDAIQRAPMPLIGGALLVSYTSGFLGAGAAGSLFVPIDLIDAASSTPEEALDSAMEGAKSIALLPRLIAGTAVISTVQVIELLIRAWLEAGWVRGQDASLEGHDVSLRDAFGQWTTAMPVFGVHLVLTGLTLIPTVTTLTGLGLAIQPLLQGDMTALEDPMHGISMSSWALFGTGGILMPIIAVYVYAGLMFAVQTAAIEERSIFSALARSWAITAGHRTPLLLCLVVFQLIYVGALIAGLMLCGVGVVLTIPLASCVVTTTRTALYRRLR